MARKPTTNPKIDDKPLSFVKLKSRFEHNPFVDGNRYLVNGEFTDSRNVPYIVKDRTAYRVKKD